MVLQKKQSNLLDFLGWRVLGIPSSLGYGAQTLTLGVKTGCEKPGKKLGPGLGKILPFGGFAVRLSVR